MPALPLSFRPERPNRSRIVVTCIASGQVIADHDCSSMPQSVVDAMAMAVQRMIDPALYLVEEVQSFGRPVAS